MSFFHVDEKTLKDLIERQQERERQREEEIKNNPEYEGHKLKLIKGFDGVTIVDADPSLIKEVEHNPDAPLVEVDTLTPMGWVRKP